MARLRTLLVTTPDGPRDILVLDDLTETQVTLSGDTVPGMPPILAAAFSIDLPDEEPDEEDA